MIDKFSDTWREVVSWGLAELNNAMERIETQGVSWEETVTIRGRISVFRELLAMQEDKEARVVELASENYGFQSAEDET